MVIGITSTASRGRFSRPQRSATLMSFPADFNERGATMRYAAQCSDGIGITVACNEDAHGKISKEADSPWKYGQISRHCRPSEKFSCCGVNFQASLGTGIAGK